MPTDSNLDLPSTRVFGLSVLSPFSAGLLGADAAAILATCTFSSDKMDALKVLAPLLVFSEEGPHYSMISFIVLAMGIVGYGQYRMFSARTAEAAAPCPEESSGQEGATMEEEEPTKKEED